MDNTELALELLGKQFRLFKSFGPTKCSYSLSTIETVKLSSKSVRMNTFISETIRAIALKFCDNMVYYFPST